MAIDTEKLHALLTAAQNPAFKKLIDERTKKLEERAKIDAEIADLDAKITDTIPPELLVILAPAKSAEPAKMRKRRMATEEPQVEKTPEPAPVAVEQKPQPQADAEEAAA
ncbi:hypothetical protein ACXR0O_07220 [Verrucomicrobiota bacterium sgz303538]